jgi:hypothetical protein
VSASLPRLPPAGPLRILAIAGTVALAAMVVALVAEARARRRHGVLSTGAALALGALATALGRLVPGLPHLAASLLALLACARNAWRLSGPARHASVVALVAWAVAVISARALFG